MGGPRFKHGLSDTPEYRSWSHMVDRALNPRCSEYEEYGGSGIGVHLRLTKFQHFLREVGPRPEGTTLDRINNKLGYVPGNLRWATHKEQNRNRRDNVWIEWDGRSQVLAAWAEELGMKSPTLRARLFEYGWSVERALTEPVGASKKRRA